MADFYTLFVGVVVSRLLLRLAMLAEGGALSASSTLLLLLLLPLRVAAQCSSVQKDPHLHFAHGGVADFRGRNGQLYNMFSAPGLAVNIKTEDSKFEVNRNHNHLVVDGSYITEVHLVVRHR